MIDVLIIDDDEVYGELTLERFETTRWQAQFHKGPFGTMNVIRALSPRLVIMDVNMPGLDGTRITDLLRKTPGLGNVRILLHSSLDQRELSALAQLHQVDAVLPKSSSRETFLAQVEQLLLAPEKRTHPRSP
jgi:CheY-like chemotaxis protein